MTSPLDRAAGPLLEAVRRSYRFTVPGNPLPKARARVVNGRAYTPKETEHAEQLVAMHARRARVKATDRPVRLVLAFYRQTAQRCDWDNLAKLVCDALNGIAWDDDSQIVQCVVTKGIDRAKPRTEVEIAEAEPACLVGARTLGALARNDDDRDPVSDTAGRDPGAM